MSGKPMAISAAKSDPRQAADIAESIGYDPENILCVPLFYDEDVVRRLELLDREEAPSYSAADMTTLGLFGRWLSSNRAPGATSRRYSARLWDRPAAFRITGERDSRRVRGPLPRGWLGRVCNLTAEVFQAT